MPQHGQTGLRPHDARYWDSARALDTGALAPARASNLAFQKVAAWPMDGNDDWGDCVAAEREHIIRLWNCLLGAAAADPTEAQVVAGYEQLSGATAPPGPGLVIADALEAWHAGQFPDGNALAQPAQTIQVHDVASIQAAVDLNGAVFCGVGLPTNAMSQFNAGQPWTLERGSNPAVDGHGVPIVGYDQQWLYIVTWAQVQKVSYNWWHWYGSEAWHVTPPVALPQGS